MLDGMPWDEKFRLRDVDNILTPALVIYPEIVAANIACTLKLLGGDANRWRAHIKTAKLDYTLRLLIDRGIRNFKCATTLELLHVCQNGAEDVLLAYPLVGANARRVVEIKQQFPQVRISVLVESPEQLPQWRGTDIGIFLDINPGMNRTGIELNAVGKLVEVIRAIADAGLQFRGLHFYDGQFGSSRRTRANSGHSHWIRSATQGRRRTAPSRNQCCGSHHRRYADVSLFPQLQRISERELCAPRVARNHRLQRRHQPRPTSRGIWIRSGGIGAKPRRQPAASRHRDLRCRAQSSLRRCRCADLRGCRTSRTLPAYSE